MPTDDRSLWKEFDQAYQNAITQWSPWLIEANRDLRFRLGGRLQWSKGDLARLKLEDREPMSFNKVKRVVNLITGYQRKNRLALKVDPVEGSDDNTARQFSGLLQFTMGADGYQTFSDAFEHGPVTTGLNLVELSLDYALDPLSGDLGFDRVPYNTVLLDPYFSKRDLSDCGYLLRRKWLSKEEVKAAFAERAKEIDSLSPQGGDGKFREAAAASNYRGDNLYRVDEFYRRTTKAAKLLVDKLTGEFRIWTGEKQRMDEFLRSPDPQSGLNFGDRVQV